LNGHLHNSDWVSDKILNVGSLLAHNFTNDSAVYKYGAWILDTDTMKIDFIENPFSFNFYKISISNAADLTKLDIIKNNTVLSLNCPKEMLGSLNNKLESITDKIITHKILTLNNSTEKLNESDIIELRGTDHIQRFIDFCHEKINNTKLLDEELLEICK